MSIEQVRIRARRLLLRSRRGGTRLDDDWLTEALATSAQFSRPDYSPLLTTEDRNTLRELLAKLVSDESHRA